MDIGKTSLSQSEETLNIEISFTILDNLGNQIVDDRLESRVVLRIALYKPGQSISLDDVHSSSLTHYVCHFLNNLELRALNLKWEAIVLNNREYLEHEISTCHDSPYYLIYHGI